ncbi:MAG: hypothetical protein ACR2GQ_05895 [Gemmatimonadota bacterium]
MRRSTRGRAHGCGVGRPLGLGLSFELTLVLSLGLTLSLGLALAAAPLHAQQPQSGALRAAAVLSADTVRVGEPFTVGVVATSADPVRFPPLLDAGDAYEQLELADVGTGDGEARAYYRLVAWETGRLELPSLAIATGGANGRTFDIALPGPEVVSVLPADTEGLLLRPPRPPGGDGFPWWMLVLGALLAAAIAWWIWRRLHPPEEVLADAAEPLLDAAQRARAALAELRRTADGGALPAPEFYDRLEVILRRYLVETRAWPATRPVRSAREVAVGAMRDLHRQAVLSRFAAVEAPTERLLVDADASLRWVDEDAA